MACLQAGVGDADLRGDRAARLRGIDDRALAARVHRFASLEVGDETLQNFPLGIADSNADAVVLGDDFLRCNEVWISYPGRLLFIRPNAQSRLVHQVQ